MHKGESFALCPGKPDQAMHHSDGGTGSGAVAAKKIKEVSLSNDVITGRVADMSCYILDRLFRRLRIVQFASACSWMNRQIFQHKSIGCAYPVYHRRWNQRRVPIK